MNNYFASVLIQDVEKFISLYCKKILDVGGAHGDYCRFLFENRNCDAFNLDPNPGVNRWHKTIVGYANNIPSEEDYFDLIICRGVLEHFNDEEREKSIVEMKRVLNKNGLLYLQFPPWYNPIAGHMLKPFHILPFGFAKFLRRLFFKNRIKAHSLGEMYLFPLTMSKMIKLLNNLDLKIIKIIDSHLRLHFLTKIPFFREFLVTSATFIVSKKIKPKHEQKII